MAFTVNIPGPKLINTNFSQSLGELGSMIGQAREDAAIRETFASMQSDDPETMERKLIALGPKGAELAFKMRTQREAAADRAATRDIARSHLGIAQENLGLTKSRHKMEQDAIEQARQGLKEFYSQGGGAAPAPAPVAPAAPAPVFPDLIEKDAAPGPGAALEGASPEEGYDISAAARRTPAQAAAQATVPAPSGGGPDIANMSEQQIINLLKHPYAPQAFKDAAKEQLKILGEKRKEKDEEAKKLSQEQGKTLGDTFRDLRDLNETANKNLYNLERQEQLLSDPRTPTGFGSGIVAGVSRALTGLEEQQRSLLGFKSPGLEGVYQGAKVRAANADELRKLQTLSVFDMLQGFGKNISDADRKVMADAYAGMSSSTAGNLAGIRFMKRVNELHKLEVAKVREYQAWQQKHGQAPKQEDIEKLRNQVRERGLAQLRAQFEADKAKYLPGGGDEGAPKGAPKAAPASPQPNQVIEYSGKQWQFIGGDPSSPRSWREAQ